MRDFPPETTAFTAGSTQHPDTRSPARFLLWLLREQGSVLWWTILLATLFALPAAIAPWALGNVIDSGITARDTGAVLLWIGVLAVVTLAGALTGGIWHIAQVRSWLIASFGTIGLVTNKSTELGHVLHRRTPTGEVLSVAGSDADQFAAFLEVTTRAIANALTYLMVAAIVLTTNVRLGVIVLLVAPLLVAVTGPILRPLQRSQAQERSRTSELTSMATDIVAGLRILRGVGGEATFGRNYAVQSQRARGAGVRAGIWGAVVEAAGVLLSGLFVVALMYLGARAVHAGELSIGGLVAFLGYALFLLQPIRVFFEFVQKFVRSLVSAEKAINIFAHGSPWPGDRNGRMDDAAPLLDEASGARLAPGLLTMVVSADPDEAAALADRFGRYLPAEAEPTSLDAGEDLTGRAARTARRANARRRRAAAEHDHARAHAPWGVRLGDVDLAEAPIEQVRAAILVSDTGSTVFAGTLQQALDPTGRLTREQAEDALAAAAGEDVYDATPGGWQGRLDERGRGLSGGQRQRLVLARALAADAPILVLVEPTSAVDAHTEAVIADRLPAARAGRTTAVMTVSPLLLRHADEVQLLAGGRIVERGTHADLFATSPRYRAVVMRGSDELDGAAGSGPGSPRAGRPSSTVPDVGGGQCGGRDD
ncbi:ATP-binding cassette domain-containing protein [Pseudactinotalea sp. HY160]|uniref:ABC transporter transmembrane domain-containing protein n=1 Tax=Pseudactinotalea sp. HY160 TaxID=2654490 RepID=UPI001313175D|nr:ATP-binding cassette domain-containing protein [Pseudactinotalea sp. HY160]